MRDVHYVANEPIANPSFGVAIHTIEGAVFMRYVVDTLGMADCNGGRTAVRPYECGCVSLVRPGRDRRKHRERDEPEHVLLRPHLADDFVAREVEIREPAAAEVGAQAVAQAHGGDAHGRGVFLAGTAARLVAEYNDETGRVLMALGSMQARLNMLVRGIRDSAARYASSTILSSGVFAARSWSLSAPTKGASSGPSATPNAISGCISVSITGLPSRTRKRSACWPANRKALMVFCSAACGEVGGSRKVVSEKLVQCAKARIWS